MSRQHWLVYVVAVGMLVLVGDGYAPPRPAHAQDPLPIVGPTLVITAPVEAEPGDLVILDASKSVAADFSWLLVESSKTFLPVDDGRRCVFASGTPGRYTFVLSAAAKDKVAVATHTLTVRNQQPDPPPVPPTPVPVPVPVPPQPDPQPLPVTPTKLFMSVFRESSATNPAEAALLTSQSLAKQLTDKGHVFRVFDPDGTFDEERGFAPIIQRVGLPCLILQNPAGDVLGAVKLPTSEAAILDEARKVGG